MTISRIPGPPGILPDLPDAMVDLDTQTGIDLMNGQWRYHDGEVITIYRKEASQGNLFPGVLLLTNP